MITEDEINQKAVEDEINPSNIEKDYVFGWLLNALYSHSSLSNLLILKGGNGLRKAYLPNTRFSKDLDFSSTEQIDITFLHDELNKICTVINEQTGIKFELDRTLVRPKNIPIPNSDVLEARLYFKGFYGEETISLKTQLDITQFDKIFLPIQSRDLIHPYSDKNLCTVNVRCQKAEEILASKLNSLLQRQKVADLFDLLYSVLFSKDFPVNKSEIISTFLKKYIYESTPNQAKQQLLEVQLESYRPLWNTLIAPLASLFQFDVVIVNFNQLIDSLFDLVLIPQSPRPDFILSYNTPSYFSSDIRNTIIEAGRSQKMVELSYEGYDRLVEPYSMKYYIRKDGVGMEYFWGYDTSGGRSGVRSIKRFICDKIQSVRFTSHNFTPRFVVEF
ncbi:MAG: nucleotidyl transferase AbiEii/AbiGii toxin family protein [Patescibacteria group bacterium]|nr:nucleotidyl transferase AbiEii/AbiGii toxin family protein [Patescibacteria group bacterium]MCL5095892.1 nucleotidyl transferase AbiEii/AbiGii toxin family protein [Patescibacteria group bacterium]